MIPDGTPPFAFHSDHQQGLFLSSDRVKRHRKFTAIVLATAVLFQTVAGEAAFLPSAASRVPGPLVVPTAAQPSSSPVDPANLAPLLSSVATVGRATPPASGGRWIIDIQDVHGNALAQKSVEAALDRLFRSRSADALILEAQTRSLDPALFRSAPDAAVRDAAAQRLFADGRISGAAHFLVTRPELVPALLPLEEEAAYRENIRVLRAALAAQPVFLRAVARLDVAAARLRKENYNAEMYVIDLAIARYEAGDMPLTSLLALLRHRGQELNYVTSALLRADTLGTLYSMSDVGSELRALLGRLQGRLSDQDAAALFDAAFRFQKGQVGTADFVTALMSVTSRHGLSLNDYPHLATHLERTLVTRSINPEKLIAAVEEIETGLPARLAVTTEERDVARLSRRLHLLRKLATLSLSAAEWQELSVAPADVESDDADIAATWERCRTLERAMSPAKDFYRWANERNAAFRRRLAEAASANRRLVVVAGGFHSPAIEETARRLGCGYVSVTPVIGDARGFDGTASLNALTRPLSPFDAALDAQAQTLAPRPLSAGDHARLAAASIARGTLDDNRRAIQWGRDQLGFLGASLVGTSVSRDANGTVVEVSIRANGRTESISVRFSRRELFFMNVTHPIRAFFTRIWRFLQRFYYLRAGIPLNGIGLHTGKPVHARFVPRPAGSGINFIRTDVDVSSRGLRVIPTILGFLGRNRRRYTGIENRGLRISMVEHLLFAMRSLGIHDADIYVNSEEMPVLDGSPRQYIDALRLFENWSPKPAQIRLEEPVVFWRDDNTMALYLPLKEEEVNSEYVFALNFPKIQTQPVEFRFTENSADLGEAQAAVGSNPTFLERPIEELRRLGFFRGGTPFAPGQSQNPSRAKDDPRGSVVLIGNPEDWTNGSFRVEGLARHKIMDVMGDEMVFLQTIRPDTAPAEAALSPAASGWLGTVRRFFAWTSRFGRPAGRAPVELLARRVHVGTGHRDNGEAELMLEMVLSGGYHFPFQYEKVVANLDKLLGENKLSREMYDYIMAAIAPYKDYDRRFAMGPPHLAQSSISPTEISRLEGVFSWKGAENPLRDHVMRGVRDYLFRSEGSALALVADRIAKPQFRIEETTAIEVRATEDVGDALLCEVTFVLPRLTPHDYPRVAMVVAKPGKEDATSHLFYSMKMASDRVPAPVEGDLGARAGDRTVNYFPLVGPYKSGVFARQWLARDFARFRPAVTSADAGRFGERLPFYMLWEGEGGHLDGLPPDEMRRKDVAKAVGAMLTAGFVRLRGVRATSMRVEAVPMSGQMIDRLDVGSDLLFDPIDGRAALAYVRATKMMSADQFLRDLLHLTYRTRTQRMLMGRGSVETEKQWQPFATDVASLLGGVEQALIEEFGPEKGRLGAIAWYERYLAALPPDPRSEDGTVARTTFSYRNLTPAGSDVPHEVFQEVRGQPIVPELEARIQALRRDLAAEATHATIIWLVRALTWLTGFPREFWVRLAPVTEGLLFATASYAAVSALHLLASGVILPGLVTATFAGLTWFLGHRTVLTAKTNETVETPFRELSLMKKLRIALVGIFVAALPAVAFAFGPVAGVAVAVVGLLLHESVKPALKGRPLRFLDESQRGSLTLQRSA